MHLAMQLELRLPKLHAKLDIADQGTPRECPGSTSECRAPHHRYLPGLPLPYRPSHLLETQPMQARLQQRERQACGHEPHQHGQRYRERDQTG